MSVELRTLRHEDVGELAALHNRAFADYPLPAQLDASQIAFYMDETDVRADLSHLALVDGEFASFCLGAVRGGQASIRGEGTDPRFRRRGLGAEVLRATVDAVRGAGAGPVGLEVIDSNAAALALYEHFGFVRRRRLTAFSLPPPKGGARLRRKPRLEPLDTDQAVGLLESWGWPDAPWQLQPDSLRHVAAEALGDEVIVLGRRRERRFWLYGIAVDPALRRRGLASRALAALDADSLGVPALVPEDWIEGNAFLHAVGARPEPLGQWEMLLAE